MVPFVQMMTLTGGSLSRLLPRHEEPTASNFNHRNYEIFTGQELLLESVKKEPGK